MCVLLVLRACETSAGSETKDLGASLNFNLVDPESYIYTSNNKTQASVKKHFYFSKAPAKGQFCFRLAAPPQKPKQKQAERAETPKENAQSIYFAGLVSQERYGNTLYVVQAPRKMPGPIKNAP